jgi:hypothetical protein
MALKFVERFRRFFRDNMYPLFSDQYDYFEEATTKICRSKRDLTEKEVAEFKQDIADMRKAVDGMFADADKMPDRFKKRKFGK